MDESGLSHFDGIGSAIRKKRSRASRRPKPDAQAFADSIDHSPLSTSTPSGDASNAAIDGNTDVNSRRKEFNLNHCMPRIPSASGVEAERANARNREGGGYNAFCGNDPRQSVMHNKRSSEGILAPANWKSTSRSDMESRTMNTYNGRNGETHKSEQSEDSMTNDNKVKKVKLKVGNVTRTINANSTTNGASSTADAQSLDLPKSRHKQNLLGNLEEDNFISDRRTGLQGVPWKDFSSGGFTLGKETYSMGRVPGKGKQGDKSEPLRKSKRVPKRRVLDEEIDEDDEIRYLEKLKNKGALGYGEDDEESNRKQRKLSTMGNGGMLRIGKDGKKSRTERELEDTDYEEEEAQVSDDELEGNHKKKKQKKESVDSLMDGKREMTLTSRQRALQSSRDGSSTAGTNFIEFPDGLPPAPSRKQKEKLSEVEMQLKKSEAAQRRRLQVEKAAQESQAEAIRKILGQDSNRKKREEKLKKRHEELAKEKAASAQMLASNTIRWTSGPTGITLTFSKDMGLPSILDCKPVRYPPPREKCAGPTCTNPFKYRDSKTNLPLCSLNCYKAMQDQGNSEADGSPSCQSAR
ncbi:hypothetical protein K2173_000860 [Erythroxylum novogranatense]|uniref:INO80 complex subunit B-like conserved region domain-containing protein n=1 Tax=Erythroxylum novogranatense TaxID=1862640 RepID=A0AAV8S7Z7_9ROSI|nr:hypothetical protein K2173_000860 [Erythroxylum novogranatense]